MPEFLISNRASVASEKNLEKIRGKSYSPMEMECNNHSYVRLVWCAQRRNTEKNFSSTPWPWAYFTNEPNAAASIALTLIRHCNDDRLWNEKALVHWKSDNNNPKNNNKKNNVDGAWAHVSGSNIIIIIIRCRAYAKLQSVIHMFTL